MTRRYRATEKLAYALEQVYRPPLYRVNSYPQIGEIDVRVQNPPYGDIEVHLYPILFGVFIAIIKGVNNYKTLFFYYNNDRFKILMYS